MKQTLFKSIFFLLLVFSTLISKSQNELGLEMKKNTVYFEILGNGILYSLNYDRLFNLTDRFKLSGRIGFHYSDKFLTENNRLIESPIEITGLYSIFRNRHFLEFGPGLTFVNSYSYTKDRSEDIIILALRIGYRYQRPEGGIFFKVGFTPLYDLYSFNPEPGIIYHTWIMFGGFGVGYTF